jgi:type I restriction enzyme, S subunit
MDMKPGYKRTEVGVIPEDWESTTIRDLASPVRNAVVGGPFGSDLVSKDYVVDGVPVIRGQNIASRYVSGPFAFVSPSKASSLEANLARPGDLIFTQRGTLGQVSIVPDLPYDRYLVSQSQMKFTAHRKYADPLFLYYVFSSSEQQDFIRRNTIQTGVPHINLGILRAIPVQRPRLTEQTNIAETLSDADTIIESLEQLLAKKRDLKQGAMQGLLTGQMRLPGFSTAWEVKRLGDLAEIIMGQSPSSIHYNSKGDGLPLIQGNADISDRKTLKRVFTTEITKRGRRDDVLVSVRAPVGEVSRAMFDVCLGRGVCAVRYPNEFLYHALIAKEPAWATLSRGSTFESVSSADVNAFEVDMPSDAAEQVAIATIISDMDAEIDVLATRLAKARAIKQGMMQELLTGQIRLV